jgi:hypothetical protein
MNSQTTSHFARNGLVALAMAAGLAAAQASSSIVTFSVDMTVEIGSGNFTNGVNTVTVHGTFNNWGAGLSLTNDPTSANPNVYSGTLDDTTEANGAVLQYKFVYSTGTDHWDAPASGQNRAAHLPANSGDSLVLPTPYWSDAGPLTDYFVAFQVDLAEQINLGAFDTNFGYVEVRGNLNGWSAGSTLTNDPTGANPTVYSGTFDVFASPNAAQAYKFVINGGTWEQPSINNQDGGGNRFFTAMDQTLPVVFFSDVPLQQTVTNYVTFQVDMSELAGGLFDPALDTVDVRGTFNNWTGNIDVCTNNPSAPNTNIYSAVVKIVDGGGATEQYKFTYSGPNVPNGTAWEQPAPPTIGGNRFFTLTNTSSQVLPVVYFSDLTPGELLPANTEVTFTVDMTGAVGTDSHVFDPAADSVNMNADFLGWPTWSPSLPQLTNNPVGSHLYSINLQFLKGSPLALTYKYSINGADNEAGFGQNHFRYIRTAGTYTLPTDIFGHQYSEPAWQTNITIGTFTGGTVPLSWLGLPGIHLQTATSLGPSATWQDVLATDGANWTGGGILSNNGLITVTNYPVTGTKLFFRLIKQ